MAHAVWKGAISFGLVNIPVSMHTAVRDSRVHFRMLHAKDRSPIRFERVCQEEDKTVPWDELVKGYEYEKGKFVVVTKEDLEAAALEKSDSLDILTFVEKDKIDDRYFETPYFLTPGKGGERAYAVLREAIRESGKVGIAKIILRDIQHLAALTVVGEGLVLMMMRFSDELADVSDFQFPRSEAVRPEEVKMAKMLVDSLSGQWDPEAYRDEYRENVMRVIQAKLKGKKIKLEPERAAAPQADVVDLMSRLKQSLEDTKRVPRKKHKRVA
jgi:DNA end-binding protein Ku